MSLASPSINPTQPTTEQTMANDGPLLRRLILGSYALIFIVIGVPLWFLTTTIYRLPLNDSQMQYYDTQITDIVRVSIPVYVSSVDADDITYTDNGMFPDIGEATQKLVDRSLEEQGVKIWGLDIKSGSGPRSIEGSSDESYHIYVTRGRQDEYQVLTNCRDTIVFYQDETLAAQLLPELVATVITDHLFKEEIAAIKELTDKSAKGRYKSKSMDYSPKYHVTFSLFNGGNRPVSWEITQAIETYFNPLKEAFSRISEITVDSQVQHFSRIGCQIEQQENGEWLLPRDGLSTFVNSAEWSLTSIYSYPTLNFILYIPSESQTPMVIEGSSTNSFSIPQWGGVVIMNQEEQKPQLNVVDLKPAFEVFLSQFMNLMGAPHSPKSPTIRLDMLARLSTVRTLVEASSTMGSLQRLSKSLDNIAIPKPVMIGVDETLNSIKESLLSLSGGDWTTALRQAGDAMLNSHSAFFDKMMVQQAYFPDEHKVAIYLPLCGPMFVVVLTGLIRVMKERKVKNGLGRDNSDQTEIQKSQQID